MNNIETEVSNQAMVRKYAEIGLAVIPIHTVYDGKCSCGNGGCRSPGKHPRTTNGLKEATVEMEQIDRWWQRWPDANIGIVTGEISGVFVLDADARAGGLESLESLLKDHAGLPETLVVVTGGEGVHVYFAWPGFPVRNSASKIAPGLDIKGEGGYVIAPPSVHHSGRAYRVFDGEFDRTRISPAPDWLLEMIRGPAGDRTLNRLSEVASDDAIGPGRRNSTLASIAGLLRRQGFSDEEMLPALLEINERRCVPPLPADEVRGLCRSIARYEPEGDLFGVDDELLLDSGAPFETAEKFIEAFHRSEGKQTLWYTGGDFYCWAGSRYVIVHRDDLRSSLYNWMDGAVQIREEQREPFRPTRRRVDDVVDALQALTYHRDIVAGESRWLGNEGPVAADEVMPCANGLLHLPDGSLLKPTPEFFTTSAVEFDYRSDAPKPSLWSRFLQELWPEDGDAIAALQEWFGYCLTADTNQQKMLLLVGPRRSGKGTIGRVLTQLIGKENVAGPTLGSLGSNFGLSPLIGRSLAIIADARLGGRSDQASICEKLLSISGEDIQTVDRKYRDPWTGRLSARIMILTNELPRFTDSAGALASRFIILQLTRSFLGRENPNLEQQLLDELPGILNWAIEGWRRLKARGHFQQPASSQRLMTQLEELQSPIKAFAEQCCAFGAEQSVPVKDLYSAWAGWCAQCGMRPGSVQIFGNNLRSAYPGVTIAQSRDEFNRRFRQYHGIGIVERPDAPFSRRF